MAARIMGLPSKPDWRSLPTEVLDLILDYLAPINDYFAFSEVCLQWQHAVLEKLPHLPSHHKRHCRHHQQLPLVLEIFSIHDSDSCSLYDVMKRKTVGSVKPWQRGYWECEGFSEGWLILIHDDHSLLFKVVLRDLFSGREIHFPPIRKTLSSVNNRSTPPRRRRYALSVDPDLKSSKDNDEFVLMISWSDSLNIAFFKPENKDWVYIEDICDVKDIVYMNGLFYVINGRGILYSVSISSCDDVYYKVRRITSHDDENYKPLSYLVESPEGDLLGINVKINQINHQPKIAIYKLVWFSKNPRWEKVKSLGDVALFLGMSRSISVTASDFPGCRTADGGEVRECNSNSVYFSSHDGPYAYIFNVKNRTVRILYMQMPESLVWVSPKFV